MLKLALLIASVAFATSAPHNQGLDQHGHHNPTHHPHPTNPTNPTNPTDPAVQQNAHIHDKYSFELEETVGYMVLNTHDTCYLWKLADSEVALAKDPATLTTLEAKMFTMVGDGTSTTSVDKHSTSVEHDVIKHCDHSQIMEFSASMVAATPSA